MNFTILGASGYIGSHLAAHLRKMGSKMFAPDRDDPSIFKKQLGHVINCVGLTSDFREKPYDTVRAHVCYLLNFLENATFQSLLYLSSTRIYAGKKTAREDTDLVSNPENPDQIYNLSKIMGESICFSTSRPTVRVARLSNVYGYDFTSNNFLCSILKDAVEKKEITLKSALKSEKDYINITDVVNILPKIAVSGSHRLYNIASGVNVSNKTLIELATKATGCKVSVVKGATSIKFPTIDIEKAKTEFAFSPTLLQHDFDNLINQLKDKHE